MENSDSSGVRSSPPQRTTLKDFALLEQKALTLCTYVVTGVHGLFQTKGYARALIGGGYPPLSEERINELVEARMARQALFDRDPLALIELILDEAALRHAIGSREIMREQFLHLIECAKRRNVTIQVMPLERGLRGAYAAARGLLTLLETPDHDHLVYLEPQDESLLISEPAKGRDVRPALCEDPI